MITDLSMETLVLDEYRGETSMTTYILKLLGVAFICLAEMVQVIKVLRTKKTKNLSTISYVLKSLAFLFLGVQSAMDVDSGQIYQVGWLCIYWLAFLAEAALACFITSNKWN
jgi:hypothetical protein